MDFFDRLFRQDFCCREGFRFREGANTPHLNPLPYTTTGLLREYNAQRLASLGSPPRGEERNRTGEPRLPSAATGAVRSAVELSLTHGET
jgi:hypothetical protein